MKTSNKLLLAFLGLVLITTTAFIGVARYYASSSFIAPSGETVKEKRPVEKFTRLVVKGNIKVILATNTQPGLELKGDKNLLKNIQTTIRDGELLIKVPFKTKSNEILEAVVSTASIETLDFSAGSSLKGMDVIASRKLSMVFNTGARGQMEVICEELFLDCSTGADLKLKGSTGYFRLISSTGAMVDALNLTAEKGNMEGSTGSVMEVNITEEIEVQLSTASVVRNLGSPVSKRMEISTGGTFTKK